MTRQLRLGIIVPSSNTTMEKEFNEMKNRNITIHSARMKLKNVAINNLIEMEREAEKEALKLADAMVDVIAYGCTTGSLIKGKEHATKIERKIERITGTPTIATANAILRAIKELDIKKISLATPYIEELNRKEKEFLEANGIKVLKMVGLGIRENIKIGRVKPETVYNLALKANIKNSDGLLISCTNLRTIEVIEKLEEELKKPVISSNTATLWNMLRKVNYRKKISGYGTLLSKL